MNLFVGTGKIISNPRIYRIKQKIFLKINIVFFKRNKKVHLYSMICFAKDKWVINLFDVLKKNDIVMVEGYLKIKSEKNFYNNKNIVIATLQAKRLYSLRKVVL
uniref:hypothetical protein n=1 Tax=Hypnea nidifica TaxID=673448 RepID=UPI0027DA47FF|nr:hypothetical protein REP52_pgp119 [Hypnea nidifica]WCH54318.1 hypothetical protein [Hypnea nidifica]